MQNKVKQDICPIQVSVLPWSVADRLPYIGMAKSNQSVCHVQIVFSGNKYLSVAESINLTFTQFPEWNFFKVVNNHTGTTDKNFLRSINDWWHMELPDTHRTKESYSQEQQYINKFNVLVGWWLSDPSPLHNCQADAIKNFVFIFNGIEEIIDRSFNKYFLLWWKIIQFHLN